MDNPYETMFPECQLDEDGFCLYCECFHYGTEEDPREDHFRDDAEADADALRSIGWGTDEDYGCFNEV